MPNLRYWLFLLSLLAFNYLIFKGICNCVKSSTDGNKPIESCEEIRSFYSRESVHVLFNQVSFKIKDSLTKTNSDYLLKASYFSCDSITGFIIVNTISDEKVYSRMTTLDWDLLKNANNKGVFFHNRILPALREVIYDSEHPDDDGEYYP